MSGTSTIISSSGISSLTTTTRPTALGTVPPSSSTTTPRSLPTGSPLNPEDNCINPEADRIKKSEDYSIEAKITITNDSEWRLKTPKNTTTATQ